MITRTELLAKIKQVTLSYDSRDMHSLQDFYKNPSVEKITSSGIPDRTDILFNFEGDESIRMRLLPFISHFNEEMMFIHTGDYKNEDGESHFFTSLEDGLQFIEYTDKGVKSKQNWEVVVMKLYKMKIAKLIA